VTGRATKKTGEATGLVLGGLGVDVSRPTAFSPPSGGGRNQTAVSEDAGGRARSWDYERPPYRSAPQHRWLMGHLAGKKGLYRLQFQAFFYFRF